MDLPHGRGKTNLSGSGVHPGVNNIHRPEQPHGPNRQPSYVNDCMQAYRTMHKAAAAASPALLAAQYVRGSHLFLYIIPNSDREDQRISEHL